MLSFTRKIKRVGNPHEIVANVSSLTDRNGAIDPLQSLAIFWSTDRFILSAVVR
jgi:hypothetical protein